MKKIITQEKISWITESMKFLESSERVIILDCVHKKQDSRIYKRLHAIILYDDGLSISKIASLFYLDEETIRSYIESFKNEGLPDLKIFRYKVKQTHLNKEQLDELKLHLSGKIYLKSEDICRYVSESMQLHISAGECLSSLRSLVLYIRNQ